jgi:hypothetical protein
MPENPLRIDQNSTDKLALGLITGTLIGTGVAFWGLNEYVKQEPVQFVYPILWAPAIKSKFMQLNFKDLQPWVEELYRLGELWGVARELTPAENYNIQQQLVSYHQLPQIGQDILELHVRACQPNREQFYLSAHIDFSRKGLVHLKGLSVDPKVSYFLGANLLQTFLPPGYFRVKEGEPTH